MTLIRTRKSPWILRIYIDVVVFRVWSVSFRNESTPLLLLFYD